jgi:hypothetical protein
MLRTPRALGVRSTSSSRRLDRDLLTGSEIALFASLTLGVDRTPLPAADAVVVTD